MVRDTSPERDTLRKELIVARTRIHVFSLSTADLINIEGVLLEAVLLLRVGANGTSHLDRLEGLENNDLEPAVIITFVLTKSSKFPVRVEIGISPDRDGDRVHDIVLLSVPKVDGFSDSALATYLQMRLHTLIVSGSGVEVESDPPEYQKTPPQNGVLYIKRK